MVAVTTTSTLCQNTPKANAIGTTWVRGSFTMPASSVTDVAFLCKVPHGAKIIDAYEYHTNAQTAAVLDFGFDRGVAAGGAGNMSCLISGGAVATMNRMSLAAAPSNLPIQISVSDSDPLKYVFFAAKAISGTFTISAQISFGIGYTMDGPDNV